MSTAVLVALCAFVLGLLGSIPMAGPVAVVVISRAAEKRYREAVQVALGAAVSESTYAGLAFFGFTTFLARYEWLLVASHAVTAVVLVVIGIYFARWKSPEGPRKPKRERQGSFLVGLTLAALNPTLLVTWSAVTAAVHTHVQRDIAQWMAVPFGLAAGSGALAWRLVLLRVLVRFEGRFPHRVLTGFVRAMGIVLVLLGIGSALKFLKHP